MTLAAAIKQFVTELAVSARIISPRFTDYRIDSFDYYTEPAEFDTILKQEVERIIDEKMAELKDKDSPKAPPNGTGGLDNGSHWQRSPHGHGRRHGTRRSSSTAIPARLLPICRSERKTAYASVSDLLMA